MRYTLLFPRILLPLKILTGMSLLLLLLSCGEDVPEEVFPEVSALTVKVVDEEGELVENAALYVNEEFRGRTSSYGETRGMERLQLEGEENVIRGEKEGYVSSL